MFTQVEFKNYRILGDVRLDLNPCTLLLGPNGSGKSTLLRGLRWISQILTGQFPSPQASDRSVAAPGTSKVEIAAVWQNSVRFDFSFGDDRISSAQQTVVGDYSGFSPGADPRQTASNLIKRLRLFSLNPDKISQSVQMVPSAEIGPDGLGLPVVLTQLQDKFPERFDSLNDDLSRWVPEFDRVLFDTPSPGNRAFSLRSAQGGQAIRAADLSHGTLLALCMLTLSHLPEPPTVVCLEEPDHGIHPRLLREVHDAVMRLCYPEQFGDKREPVQVIATTHSPYLLDLFRGHPEDVVLAEKADDGVKFHRLTDMPHYSEIMEDAALGDAWYTGILGGVPATP